MSIQGVVRNDSVSGFIFQQEKNAWRRHFRPKNLVLHRNGSSGKSIHQQASFPLQFAEENGQVGRPDFQIPNDQADLLPGAVINFQQITLLLSDQHQVQGNSVPFQVIIEPTQQLPQQLLITGRVWEGPFV
jgi:hypothetical protein